MRSIENSIGNADVRPRPRSAHSGGCVFALDPDRDAREVAPIWIDEEDTVVRLVPTDIGSDACSRFDLWQLPCGRALVHDGAHLRVCIRAQQVTFSVHLDNSLTCGQSFGYLLPANSSLANAQELVAQFAALYNGEQARCRSYSLPRPSRASLYHLRALQALDGVASGASQRDIAGVLVGDDVATKQWSTDSALRAQVRSLIERGRKFVSGGYRALLGNKKRTAQGGNA